MVMSAPYYSQCNLYIKNELGNFMLEFTIFRVLNKSFHCGLTLEAHNVQ